MNVSGGVKAVRLGMLAALFASIPAEGAGPHPVRAQLVADVATVSPGAAFSLGVQLKMEEGWHVYWRHEDRLDPTGRF